MELVNLKRSGECFNQFNSVYNEPKREGHSSR